MSTRSLIRTEAMWILIFIILMVCIILCLPKDLSPILQQDWVALFLILKRNIQLLKEHPKVQIRIAGYTSASGSKNYNQKLSERRAGVVQEYLINEGVITRDRLSKIGYGETNPAMHEAAPKEIYSEAAKANMRVLFEIIVK
jgi:hypothetical protein